FFGGRPTSSPLHGGAGGPQLARHPPASIHPAPLFEKGGGCTTPNRNATLTQSPLYASSLSSRACAAVAGAACGSTAPTPAPATLLLATFATHRHASAPDRQRV